MICNSVKFHAHIKLDRNEIRSNFTFLNIERKSSFSLVGLQYVFWDLHKLRVMFLSFCNTLERKHSILLHPYFRYASQDVDDKAGRRMRRDKNVNAISHRAICYLV